MKTIAHLQSALRQSAMSSPLPGGRAASARRSFFRFPLSAFRFSPPGPASFRFQVSGFKFPSSAPAFTLVELLVVIAIIGILAAMLLPVLARVGDAAKKAKARTEMSAIVTAIEAYDQDYSRFPMTTVEQTAAGTNDFTTGLYGFGPGAGTKGYSSDNNSNTIAILMDLTAYPNGNATANAGHAKNPKQVKYLTPKLSDYDQNTSTDPKPPGGVDRNGVYRDPWGNPYVITMNTSYSDLGTSDYLYSLESVSQQNGVNGYNGLFNPVDANGNGDHFYYHGKVMVWSAGPDGKYDTGHANAGVNKDNVISW